MAAGTKVGTGYVAIEPDFSGFQREVERAISSRFSRLGDQAGSKLTDGISRRVRSQRDGFGLVSALAPQVKRFEKVGDQAGKALGDRIGKGAARARGDTFGLADAIAEVEQRTNGASRAAKGLERDMFGIGRAAKDVGRVMVSTTRSDLREFGRAHMKAAAAAREAKYEVVDLAAEIKRRTPAMASSAQGVQRDMFGIGDAARVAGRSMSGLPTPSADLRRWRETASATARASQTLTGRVRALGTRLRGIGGDARTAAGGFGGMNGVMARVNRSAQFFRNAIRLLKFPALIAGLGLATQGLAALAAGFTAAASAVGPLAGALVALPAAVVTAAQAFGALKLATAGIGDAIKAALDAQVKGGGQAVDTMGQQRAAADRVADAELALADAQRQTKIVQDDLTAARKEARRELQDMALAAERSGTSEEAAFLHLRQLRRELLQTALDPESTELDIRIDENALKQAQYDLRETRIEAKRTRADHKDAADEGVKGMPAIVSARRAEAEASRVEAAAQRDLQRAVEASTETMAAQGAAATKLAEEMGQLPPAAQAFVRQIVSMKPKLDELRATAASGLFPGVSTGLRGLMGNFGVVKGIVGDTASAFGGLAARAGKALGGADWGRDLKRIGAQNVRSINQMGRAGGNLADTFRHILVAARPFVNWLGKGTVALTGWMKTEVEAGRKSGRLAAFFERTKKSMQLLGPILKGVGGAFLNIGKAARPLGNDILKTLGRAAEGWRKWTGSVQGQNSLKHYFADAKPAIWEMGRLLRDVTKAFFTLGNQPGAAKLIKQVRTELLPSLVDVVRTLTGAFGKALVSALTNVVRLVGELADHNGPLVAFVKIVGGAAGGFAKLLKHNQGLETLVVTVIGLAAGLKALKFVGAISGISSLGRAALATTGAFKALRTGQAASEVMTKRGIAASIAAKIAMLASAGATRAWAFAQRILNVAMRANPLGLVVTALALVGTALVAAYKKSETFRNIVNGAFRAVVDAGKFLADKYLGYVTMILGGFSSLASAASKLPFVGGKFKGLARAIDGARDRIDGFRETLRGGNRDASRTAGLKAQQAEVDRLKNKLGNLKKGTAEYKRTAEALRKAQRDLNDVLRDTRPAANNAGKGISTLKGNADNLGGALGNVTTYTQDEVNKLLRDFGAKPFKHKVKPWKPFQNRINPFSGGALQQGGPVVPGTGSGDKFRTALPEGSFVLNREATAAFGFDRGGQVPVALEPGERVFHPDEVRRVGLKRLEAVNQAVPRFQTGGIVGLGRELQRQGYQVGEHPAFGSVGSHAPNSYHYRGMAIDVNADGRPGGEAMWLDRLHARLKKMPGVVELLWRTADHFDHLHVAMSGAGGPLGALGGAVANIAKLKISGGTDTTRGILQGASDRLTKGANSYLAAHLGGIEGAESGVFTTASGDDAELMKAISRERGWKFADWWEVDRRETGHGADIFNESSGAALRGQFMPGITQGSYGPGSDPGQNPSMREQIISMARYIAERYGNPTKAREFHDAHNWYQKGGLVKMVGDSLGLGTVRQGGLASKIKNLRADNREGRPSSEGVGLFGDAAKQFIFDLGSNDTSAGEPAANLRRVDRLTGDAPLHAMTVNGALAGEKNAALRGVAGGDVSLVPWAAQSRGQLEPDGVHATAAGYGKRANLIAASVRKAADKVKRQTIAKKLAGSNRKGGIGSPLGEIDISQATGRWNLSQSIRQTLKRVRRPQSKKGTRQKQMARLMDRINEQFSLDPTLLARLTGHEAQDPFLLDQADRADSLTFDVMDADGEPVLDPEGRQVVDLGRMGGRTAAEWTRQRLEALISWRNDLIEARVAAGEVIAEVAKQIAAMHARAEELRVAIAKQTEKIVEQLAIKEKLTELIAAKRRPKKLAAKIKSLSKWLAPKLGVKAKVLRAETREQLGRRLNQVVAERNETIRRRRVNRRERRAIVDKIIPALEGRHTALTEDRVTYEDGLTSVQGPGGGRERADKFFGIPQLGQFSGNIFEAHQRLNELHTLPPKVQREPGVDGADSADSERAELAEQREREANQRTLVSESQFKTLRQYFIGDAVPFAGTFHQGGVVPGPKGAERIALVQAGETITPADTDVSAPAAVPQVNINVAPGMEWLKQFIRVEVVKETRASGRGSRRAMAGVGRGV